MKQPNGSGSGRQDQQILVTRENSKLSSSELRKINKPIVEKIRRDKINGYLDELKGIILKSSPNSLPQSSPSSISNNPSKLEKADILELTVNRLGELEEKVPKEYFEKGYEECKSDLTNIIQSADGLDIRTREMIINQILHSTPRRISSTAPKHQSTPALRQSPHLDQENVGVGPIRAKKHRVHARTSISLNVSCRPELTLIQTSTPMPLVHPSYSYLPFTTLPVENGMVYSRNPLASISQNVVTVKAEDPKTRPAIPTSPPSDVPRVETKLQPLHSVRKPWRPW